MPGQLERLAREPVVQIELEITQLRGARGSPVPQLPRAALPAGQRLQGPAVITEDFATLWLRPGWQLEVDRVGNLCLERMV